MDRKERIKSALEFKKFQSWLEGRPEGTVFTVRHVFLCPIAEYLREQGETNFTVSPNTIGLFPIRDEDASDDLDHAFPTIPLPDNLKRLVYKIDQHVSEEISKEEILELLSQEELA